MIPREAEKDDGWLRHPLSELLCFAADDVGGFRIGLASSGVVGGRKIGSFRTRSG